MLYHPDSYRDKEAFSINILQLLTVVSNRGANIDVSCNRAKGILKKIRRHLVSPYL